MKTARQFRTKKADCKKSFTCFENLSADEKRLSADQNCKTKSKPKTRLTETDSLRCCTGNCRSLRTTLIVMISNSCEFGLTKNAPVLKEILAAKMTWSFDDVFIVVFRRNVLFVSPFCLTLDFLYKSKITKYQKKETQN